MMEEYVIRAIGHIRSDYNEKFGIPRQPGLVKDLKQAVVLTPEFSNADALRGLEDFDYIWLIWGFSKNALDMTADHLKWSPTVRPPRLGGGERKGVWATRSPYRPNSLAMSSVKLEGIELDGRPLKETGKSGLCTGKLAVIISGADIMNGSPVYDIKPYIPYSDCHTEARGGFTDTAEFSVLKVEFPQDLLELIDEEKRCGLISILELDPRGAYEKNPGYTYGMSFGRYDIRFRVDGDMLTVTDVMSQGDGSFDSSADMKIRERKGRICSEK